MLTEVFLLRGKIPILLDLLLPLFRPKFQCPVIGDVITRMRSDALGAT